MKRIAFTPQLGMRILVILSVVMAIFSLTRRYWTAYLVPQKSIEPRITEFNTLFGYELATAFFAVILLLIIAGLLLFAPPKKWVKITTLIATILLILIVYIAVKLEVALNWLFAETISTHICPGYWVLLTASVLVFVCSIWNFYLRPYQPTDDRIIDDQL